ncbi:MAG: ABC transporter substrate-binding protein, partial [Nitriliruptoraceae bacterium]
TLRVGLDRDPTSLDPRFVVDGEGELIVGALFEPLVRLDDRSRIMFGAAESYEILDGGTAFRFRLRDAEFHDGTPVTAGDVKRTFDDIADTTASRRSPWAFLLEPIRGADEATNDGLAGVIVEDEQTIRIELDEPDPGFLLTLAHPVLAPLPQAADDAASFAEQPIGNGPFAMAEPRARGSFLRLRAVDDHAREPQVNEVLFSVYGDEAGRDLQWNDLSSGQLHVGHVDPSRRADARTQFGAANDGHAGSGVLDGLTGAVYLYAFDVAEPPFDDPRVRRAISMSINRAAMSDELFSGERVPARSIVPPAIPGATGSACDHCAFDQIGARQLWDEAAVEVTSITLSHNRGATHAAIAERIAADIERTFGVTVELESWDLPTYLDQAAAGELSVFRLGWEPTEPDPGGYLEPMFHSTSPETENLTGYANEDVDALLNEARIAELRGVRMARYADAERAILADAPVIPLFHYQLSLVVRPEVRGLRWSPLGRVDFAAIELITQAS